MSRLDVIFQSGWMNAAIATKGAFLWLFSRVNHQMLFEVEFFGKFRPTLRTNKLAVCISDSNFKHARGIGHLQLRIYCLRMMVSLNMIFDFGGFVGTIGAIRTFVWFFSRMNHEMALQIGRPIKYMLANGTDELALHFQGSFIQLVGFALIQIFLLQTQW